MQRTAIPSPRPRVYLAGFDVFKPDAASVFAALVAHAEMRGLQSLVPSDEGLVVGRDGSAAEIARRIRDANVAMLRQADGVIANLAPFRGLEPDAGTVFEVGFAAALGLPMVGYGVPRGSYAEQVGAAIACERPDGGRLVERATGMAVEDFGLPLNLMLACSLDLVETAVEALDRLAACLSAPARQ